jgi:hypothetical protein
MITSRDKGRGTRDEGLGTRDWGQAKIIPEGFSIGRKAWPKIHPLLPFALA